MNSPVSAESLALWIADYYLLASVLLFAALASSWFLKQPAQRLATTKATIAALVLLALLCAVPGWSLVHLVTAEQPRANGSQAAPLELTPVADLPSIPAADPIDFESVAFSPPAAQLNEPQSTPLSTTKWRDLPWARIVVAAHGIGTVFVFAWLVVGALAARRLLRSAQTAPQELNVVLAEIAALQQIPSRIPALKISNRIDVAVALGIFRPTVLLPTNWLESHAPDQLRTVLAHELAHVANHDLRWRAASRALVALLWAQPLLWLVRRRMRLDQEALADAAASNLTSRQHYAEQLVAWARGMPTRPTMHLSAAVGLWEGPSQLHQRIALLLNDHFTVLRNCSHSWRTAAHILAVLAALALSLITLAAPQTLLPPATLPQTSIFQHGIERQGLVPTALFNDRPSVLWKFTPIPLKNSRTFPDLGGVSASDRVLFSSDRSGRLFALDTAEGDLLWFFQTERHDRSQPPLVADKIVYYAGGDGVTALDRHTGEHIWTHEIPNTGAAECSPILVGGRLFVTGYDGVMRALNAETGELIWQCELLSDAPQVARGPKGNEARLDDTKARPVIPASDGKVIYQPIFDQMRIVAVDCTTGQRRWSFETGGWMHGNPTVADDRVYFGSQDRHFYCLEAETGKELWRFQTQSRVEAGAALLNNWLYFGCCAGIVYCVDATNGEEIWRFTLDRSNDRSPIYCAPLVSPDGDLYIAGMEGQVYCLDAISGELKWKLRPSANSEIDSDLATDGERLFIATRPDSKELGEKAIFAIGPRELGQSSPVAQGATAENESDRIAIDDRFMLCRVTTDLQHSLLGDVAEPVADASLCVFVNYAAFADEPLDSGLPSFSALSDRLTRLAKDDNRYVLMRVMVAEVSIGSDFEKVHKRAQALAKLCEDLGRAAGYKRAKWSTSYGGDDWKTFIERASPTLEVTDVKDESSVGDEQVQVFPVRTFLSRLLTNADCVVNLNPVVRHKEGTRFPDDFVPAMTKFIPQLEFDRKQTLFIRVRNAESAKDRLYEWVRDRSAREALANQFGFEECYLQPSFTVEPEKAADAGATAGLAATKPVDIPIIVAKHVLMHNGKIIEWADLEKMIAALPNPKLAHPVFKFTVEGGTARQEEIRAKIWELRRRVEIQGHTWSSVSPQMSPHYDLIRNVADLNLESRRVQGTVETADGLPIDDAAVFVLQSQEPPSNRVFVFLQNERLHKLQDEIVTRSDASGRFSVYPQPEMPYYLVALHREGFGLVRSDEFTKARRIAIQPWAHVKGRIKSDEPTDQSAAATMLVPGEAHSAKFNWPTIEFHQLAADVGPPPDRLFEIAFVPPLPKGWLSSLAMGEQGSIQLTRHKEKELELSPGKTLNMGIDLPSDAEAARIQERLSGFQRMQERFGFPGAEQVREVAPNELAGRVVDDDGIPLAGVVVDAWTWNPGNETVTDADGRFTLSGFDDREVVEVQFTKPGYGSAHFAAQQTGRGDWTVTLANDTYLDGRVLGPDGKPVPRARIRAARGPFQNPQVQIGEVWTETGADADGSYRMYFEPDTYDIHVRVPGVGLARLQNTVVAKGDQRQLDIQLRQGPTFRALVLDIETNEPVAGIRLWNWRQEGIEGVSDDAGMVTIENMTPGPFEFDVTAVGEPRGSNLAGKHARWWSPDAIEEHQRKIEYDNSAFQRNFDGLTFNILGNTEPVIIYVEKAVSIRGRVTDPDGNPVAGATVAPAKTGTGNSITGDTRYSVRTESDGTFRIQLPASNNSKYNLVAHDGGYQEWRNWANGVGEVLTTRPGEELADVVLKLTRPGVVRGKVVDGDGKPMAKHRVRTQPTDYLENRYYDPETRTNENGEFELEFVRPGEHFVQADPFWLVDNEAESEASRRVTVKPDEAVDGIELIHRPAESRPPLDHILPDVPIPSVRPLR